MQTFTFVTYVGKNSYFNESKISKVRIVLPFFFYGKGIVLPKVKFLSLLHYHDNVPYVLFTISDK